jgi:hypothetical protein
MYGIEKTQKRGNLKIKISTMGNKIYKYESGHGNNL